MKMHQLIAQLKEDNKDKLPIVSKIKMSSWTYKHFLQELAEDGLPTTESPVVTIDSVKIELDNELLTGEVVLL